MNLVNGTPAVQHDLVGRRDRPLTGNRRHLVHRELDVLQAARPALLQIGHCFQHGLVEPLRPGPGRRDVGGQQGRPQSPAAPVAAGHRRLGHRRYSSTRQERSSRPTGTSDARRAHAPAGIWIGTCHDGSV